MIMEAADTNQSPEIGTRTYTIESFIFCQVTFPLWNSYKWCLDTSNGYICRTDSKKKIYLHREIFLFLGFDVKNMEIDHINGNRTDNRLENLRICHKYQNTFNSSKKKNSYSKYKGVTFDRARNKWKVSLTKGGKSLFNKRVDSELEAAKLYDEHARIHFGQYARLNFIEEKL